MVDELDVMAPAGEGERECRSGKLSKDLLEQENTLYGENPNDSEYSERITPDGSKSL